MDQETRNPKSILFAADGTSDLWDLLTTPVGFVLDHKRGFSPSLAAVKRHRYDAIVVTLPLGGGPFGEFVQTIRSLDCPCRNTGLVILTTTDRLEEANAFIGSGVNRVVSIDDPDGLRRAIVDVIDVGLRTPIRLMTRLTIGISGRDCRIRTYTQNVSRSGMLLDTSNKLNIGQQFEFSFRSPLGDRLVSGRAEVVRHTRDDREQISGIGVQFIQLDENSTDALAELFETTR